MSSIGALIDKINIGEEYFWEPERLVPFEHWCGHIPFAFWLIKVLRPRRLVELGTHCGNSYCAFCQAVSALGLETQSTAIDTWKGDLHMRQEIGIYEELRNYHDPRYAQFSNLLRLTFDEARSQFEEGSIDLLHIDGTHTYEAVRHDFEHWRTALSPRSVVVFHDVAVRQDNFGVWKLWKELASQYPSFEFQHSFGLGVLGVGPAQDAGMLELYAAAQDGEATSRIRSVFSARGEALISRLRLADAGISLDLEGERTKRRMQAEAQERLSAQVQNLGLELDDARSRIVQGLAAHAREIEAERQKARRWVRELQAAHARELATEREEAHCREALSWDKWHAERDALRSVTADTLRQARAETEMWRERGLDLQSRMDAVEASTIWQVRRLMSRILGVFPARIRHLVRHGFRFARRASWPNDERGGEADRNDGPDRQRPVSKIVRRHP